MGRLTNRQRVFVEHYLTCWNATEAARKAGYSPNTANEQGSQLLAKLSIQAAVERRIGQIKAGADEVLIRLASYSRGTMDDFLGSMDRIDLDRARERGVMHLIKKIKQKTTTFSKSQGEDVETHEIELELYDAQQATVQLARILGLYVERIEVTHDWRKEATAAGLDADALADELFAKVATLDTPPTAALQPGATSDPSPD